MTYLCDWCGEEIGGQRGCARLDANGLHSDRGLVWFEASHYHAGAFDDSAYPIYSVGRGTDRVSTAQREIHGARAWTASDNRSLTARLRKQSGMHFDDNDSCLLQALRLLDAHHATNRPVTPREQRARDLAASREADEVWRQTPRERREVLLFQVLGDEALILRELTERMNGELGFPQPPGTRAPRAVYDGSVRSLVQRMLRDGQLERKSETFNKTHMRYRYFRRRGLEGPIADLERAYRDDSEREEA
jgi:hypothetical protein